MIEDESLSLLAEAAASLSSLEATPSPNAGTAAKVRPRDGRRQFTLASLPFLTIYLQGIPSYLPGSLALALDPKAAQPLPGSLALAQDLGVLKLRALPYPRLEQATRIHYGATFQSLVAVGKAFTTEWLATTKELLTKNPILLESTTLARIQDEFLSSTRATQALGNWLATLPDLPTNPTSTPALSLDELSII